MDDPRYLIVVIAETGRLDMVTGDATPSATRAVAESLLAADPRIAEVIVRPAGGATGRAALLRRGRHWIEPSTGRSPGPDPRPLG